ncbi:hypothetical protein HOY82DRAFT_600134 [Tuber indicum]|nr:hypothetical protein HOY82DRAFT_600134 [Tuber indicum]
MVQPLDISINRPYKDILKEILEEKVDEMEVEEEQVLAEGGQLSGSMVGRRRVLCTWAVGEAWERFSTNQTRVVERAFTAVGLSLPIDGSRDSEISVKGLDTSLFVEGMKGWADGAMVASGRVEEDENGEEEQDQAPELEVMYDELDGEYIVGDTD